MKKTLLVLLTLIIGINLNTQAEDFSAYNNGSLIYYNITSSTSTRTVEVTHKGSLYYNYPNEYSGIVLIPDSVLYSGSYYVVTLIGNSAFSDCSGLTSITIPNSVTSIDDYAFYGCSGLTSITIPTAVTSFGDGAFSDCSGLTSITIPNSVTSIDDYAFYGCSGLTSITIPNSVTSVGDYSFYGCSGSTSITIGNSVTSIGDFTFYGCSGSTSITIGNSVISIGNEAFSYCFGLTSITIGNSVTSIGYDAFEDCIGLTSITIPNSVTSIGNSAFSGCTGLTSITIPNSVTSISNGAFSNCTSLDTVHFNAVNCTSMGSASYKVFEGCNNLSVVLIGDSVSNIPSYAFKDCGELNSLTIGHSVTSIGTNAFQNCNAINEINYNAINCNSLNSNFYNRATLSALNIGNQVIKIPSYAFESCTGLTSITIPDSVTSIGEYAFSNCSGLTSVTIPNSVTSIGNQAFSYCSGLTSITIPNSVTSIGESAFSNCSGLTSITIGNSVSLIDDWAFSHCTSLDTIYFNAENCSSMGDPYSVFFDCDNLSVVIFGDSVTKIPSYAFSGCSGLTSITIPNSVTSIGTYAFYYCIGLTSITIPNSVNSIGDYAFRDCSGLTSITIGNSVTSIGYDAFGYCSGLTSIIVQGGNTSYSSIDGVLFNKNATVLIKFPEGKSGNYEIPSSVTSIGNDAFQNCSGLTSITIPNSIDSIGQNAFSGCYQLASIICNAVNPPNIYPTTFGYNTSIPLYVPCTSIPSYQSASNWSEYTNYIGIITAQYITDTICANQTYTNYGANINSAGNYTLVNDCDSVILTLIVKPIYRDTIYATILQGQTYNQNGFNQNSTGIYSNTLQSINGCDSIVTLNLSVVNSFSAINNDGDTIYYKLTTFTTPYKAAVTFKGSTMYSYDNEYIDSINIPPSILFNGVNVDITSIGDYAFGYCGRLTYINIPNSVTSIGDYAFDFCGGLTSINIPNSVTSIGDYAFGYCGGLTYINISNSVTSIGSWAFEMCTGLTSIIIPNSVTSISVGVFEDCWGLFSITLPNSITSIGSSAFSECSRLSSIIIPNSVTSIGDYTFEMCLGLTSITIPNSVTLIGINAFGYCNALDTVYFNATNCTSMGSSSNPVFEGCNNLSVVLIGDSVFNIPSNAFYGCSAVTSITIPKLVVSIGNAAFGNCNSLNNVFFNAVNCITMGSSTSPVFYGYNNFRNLVIGDSVQNIPNCAFQNCSRLTSITIPNSVTSIGNNAFYNCSGLNSITIPNSVTSIGNNAFYNCSGLNSINFNAINCILMGNSSNPVFDNCRNIRTITIGNMVNNIPSYAFKGCDSLNSVVIGNSVSTIGTQAFGYCNKLNTLDFNPINCTSMGGVLSSPFYNCSTLATLNIGNQVKNIPNNAFYGCSGLASVNIPDSVISIGINAFRNISGLQNLNIGLSVATIKDSAFYNCENISNIIIKAINPPLIYRNTFYNVYPGVSISVPCASIQEYQTTTWWNAFTNYRSFKTLQIINSSICNGEVYTNFGANINTAGVYTLINGCDSVILNLNITPSIITNYYDTICKGTLYSNYGFSFVSDNNGIYTHNLQTINGCDSIVNLNLIVNPIYNDTIIAEICQGDIYTLNGFNTSIAGLHTLNLQTTKGCDSTVNLTLIVHQPAITNLTAEICQGDIYTLNGFNTSIAGLHTINLQTIKGCDSTVNLNLIVNQPAITNLTAEICQGGTYNLNGFNTNTQGQHMLNLQTYKGCDSTVNLNLIVNQPAITNLSAEICQGETYNLNGFNASTAGLHTLNLQTIKGCDSTVNLTLTVNQPAITNLTAEICQGEVYTLNGFNVSTAGLHTLNLQTYKGCDSTVNLTLTINQLAITNLTAEICQGGVYTLNGFNVSTAGLHTQNLQTIKGCDSIVNLTLTVNQPVITNLTAEICQGETYALNGFNASTAGLHTLNLQTTKGCDSTVNLTLTVNQPAITNLTAEICQGGVYTLNGFNTSTAGLHTQNLQTIKGCDSIINLTLTVNQPAVTNLTAEICQGEVYTLNGFNTSIAGLHTLNLQTIKGCDSIVNLTLIVNPVYLVNYVDNICKGYEYNNYGFNFIADTSGVYTRNYQTINGCDSVFVLNLVVNPTPIVPEDLNVQVMTNFIEITWQSNGSSYIIYRNNDSLTTVNQPIYLDYNVINEQPYCYKVKSINGDCESEFSDIVCKSFSGLNDISSNTIQTKLYPNPTDGKTKLEVGELSSEADVIVSDLLGRVIQTHKINKGKRELDIDLSGYAKGVYSIRIMNDSINQTKKLIVQ